MEEQKNNSLTASDDMAEEIYEFRRLRESLEDKPFTIIIFGASGHLARTKTFPALFDLFIENVYPKEFHIIGFARSSLTKEAFHKQVVDKIKGDNVKEFLNHCSYVQCKDYDDSNSYQLLQECINSKTQNKNSNQGAYFLCYLATPPNVYAEICNCISKYISHDQTSGWTRVIIEKPFGLDLETSDTLQNNISKHLSESQVYRIDHYLAKEMVQNLLVFRFSNTIWDTLWDRKSISCVKISMKEDAGVDGRGSYYDDVGVIRDVFQNHLLQVLSLIAMEQPVSLKSEDIRDEKLKVLKAIESLTIKNSVIGQYASSENGKLPGYLDDPSIKNSSNPNSLQCTFIQSIIHIKNGRWNGVPFICKAGKALDSRNTEVRIQFKNDGLCLFPNAAFNELVFRLQPNEAIWLKVNTKNPGFSRFDKATQYELDLTYKTRFGDIKLPEAYTRLILDCMKGDQSLFVRQDELREAWRIVTPLLHTVEKQKIQPLLYPRGTRGPVEADRQAAKFGFRRTEEYQRGPTSSPKPNTKL